MLEDVVEQALKCSKAEFKHVEDELGKIKERVRKYSEVSESGIDVLPSSDEPATDSKALRTIGDTHTALKLTLVAVVKNPVVLTGLGEVCKNKVLETLELLCTMSQRFFSSKSALLEYQHDTYGFTFINPIRPNMLLSNISNPLLDALTDSMYALLPSLLPTLDFDARREGVRYGLERIILSSLQTGFLGDNNTLTPLSVVPAGCSLHLFGSSINGFGADSSDLDMCLLVPDENSNTASNNTSNLMMLPPPKNRAEIVEGLGRVLLEASKCGKLAVLEDLSTRPTARIPLVNFKLRGVDVDISVHNPLALRNSQMLKAYSKCDQRLIALAYMVKYWAKRRHVNNASEGTLSSYGYILCLIHFLQTRQPAILPNLQAIPPNWDGNPRHAPREVPNRQEQTSNRSMPLPSVPVAHPVDGHLVETYFYTPPKADYFALSKFGQFNSQSVGSLFVEFFHYMTLQVEPADEVISVRFPKMSKLTKAEQECW